MHVLVCVCVVGGGGAGVKGWGEGRDDGQIRRINMSKLERGQREIFQTAENEYRTASVMN